MVAYKKQSRSPDFVPDDLPSRGDVLIESYRRRPDRSCGEINFLIAMLGLAMMDLSYAVKAGVWPGQRRAQSGGPLSIEIDGPYARANDAARWVRDEIPGSTLPFAYVCEELGLPEDAVRRALGLDTAYARVTPLLRRADLMAFLIGPRRRKLRPRITLNRGGAG